MMIINSDDNHDNANRNGKTKQIATTDTTHAASSSSTSGNAVTTTATTIATTTTASATPTAVCISEKDRRAMDVLSDILIQACMAMFVTSLGLRTVR